MVSFCFLKQQNYLILNLQLVKETPIMHLLLSEDPVELTVPSNALASCVTTVSTKPLPVVPSNVCGMLPVIPSNAC
ncbi:hypothetical protein MKX03_033838, partial [Papaver bracteatum]